MNYWRKLWLVLRGDHVVIPVETYAELLRRVAQAERRAAAQRVSRATRAANLPSIGAAE